MVSRIGKKLVGFDALEAGAYVVRPDVFDVLHRLLVESIYCTLAEAMQVVASEGQLSYISVGDYDWFGEQTVASLPTPASFSSAVQPEWRQRALDMLRITSPHLVALSGYSNLAGQELPPVPLYDLGDAIGAGGSSVVVQANLHRSPSSCSPMQTRRRGNLAVKVIRKGATEALGDVERSVMWEVHVLQQLSHEYAPAALEAATGHALSVATAMRACLCCAWAPATRPLPLVDTILPPDALSARLPTLPHPPLAHPLARSHIVRVMDVIEVVDATYIIMQRVDGPELTEYCERHSGRRLPAETATRILGHLLSALRHAHRHGFLHCDIKPDNVRLNKACDHAVLTDWGYARRPGERSDRFFCGTPAYASPEQLTGYSPDSVTGRRKLCPATDVWSLGVTLFEMVAGALPFPADDHEALIRSVLSTKCAHPPTHTPTHPHARTHAHPPPRTHARTRAHHHTHARGRTTRTHARGRTTQPRSRRARAHCVALLAGTISPMTSPRPSQPSSKGCSPSHPPIASASTRSSPPIISRLSAPLYHPRGRQTSPFTSTGRSSCAAHATRMPRRAPLVASSTHTCARWASRRLIASACSGRCSTDPCASVQSGPTYAPRTRPSGCTTSTSWMTSHRSSRPR